MKVLNRIWAGWKKYGQMIGDFIARLVLTLFYFTIFLPFGVGVRLLGDPLGLRRGEEIKWLDRRTHDLTMDDARRYF
jgi:hypothetical protein